jgi:hypothetical protein
MEIMAGTTELLFFGWLSFFLRPPLRQFSSLPPTA